MIVLIDATERTTTSHAQGQVLASHTGGASAGREGRSVSEVARELVSRDLDDLAREAGSVWRGRVPALARLDQIRARLEESHGVYAGDLVTAARADRERDLDAVGEAGGP